MRLKNAFEIPNLDHLLKSKVKTNEAIVVVSIIGKSSLHTRGLKVKSIGRLFPIGSERLDKALIRGTYDERRKTVHLHLYSHLDTDIIVEKLGGFGKESTFVENFLAANDEFKSTFCKHFLFLLHVSHIIVLSHPGISFDTNYMQYFKAMESLSKNFASKISERLGALDVLSQQWVTRSRPCIPRMLFYFERANTTSIASIKKLEHNLEDKIYHILKKGRIITSASSLFAIPLNDEFVFVSEERPKDQLSELMRGLIQDCKPGAAIQVEAPFSSQPSMGKDFLRFLTVHIEQAKAGRFDDIVSRHQHSPTYFELPKLEHWIAAVKCLYTTIIEEEESITSLHIDTRFSEQRCLKVLPLAIARYQEGLSSHYDKSEHEARLAVALGLFRAQARGSKYPQYELRLENECRAYWENGRQQCEAASMTGNPCKLPKHSSDLEHISGFVYKSFCDCGRKVGPRDDPYSALQANSLFYQQMAKDCQCSKYERIEFPVFEPSIAEYKAATIHEADEAQLSDRSVQLTPLELGEKCFVRQASTTEYLPGMLTLSSPSGLLPIFSSWSLVCLGASSLYSHNVGLTESNHPGFLSSTNYLLPWDVTVASKSKKAWPVIAKSPSRWRRAKSNNTAAPQTVKVFIGLEYECTSGHRFMLSAPDKMLKATSGSTVKETGHKIAESDMPLYYPCTCRANKIGQLMRLHVVTPKAPVCCTLNPRVQPAAGAPVFISTHNGPIKLTQSGYWVMRLPFVYVDEKEHFKQNSTGKLLQGTFAVVDAD